MRKDTTRINRMIRSPEVRVIDAEGKQLGVLPILSALKASDDAGLDLVEVSPNAVPPVCRIMDYGKYKYQLSKKAHEAKKKQVVIHVKEIKLRVTTQGHDIGVKLKSIKKFLAHGDKVKIGVFFKGREIANPRFGTDMLKLVAEELKDAAVIEQQPKLEGRSMIMVVAPAQNK